MEFNTKIPEWKNEGTEPSENLKTNGFKQGYKPPAGVFNWFWSKISKAITEIQTNLINVDNTKDSEKSVKFASEAGIGRKVANALTVRFKGGDTEGTDKWTFDGSTSRSVNITPEKIGARPTDKPSIVVSAVREETADGKEIYIVSDSNITELYNGLEITIIPSATNTTNQPRLKINDLEDKGIRLPLSFNCAATDTVKANYFKDGRPITLKYHSELNLGIQGQGAWLFADRQKTSAQDLYGDVPIESGGTGASTAEEALENFGVNDYIVEQATDGFWTYRKWASGIAECWKTETYSFTPNEKWGVMFGEKEYDSTKPNVNGLKLQLTQFPSNLFTETEVCSVDFCQAGYVMFPWVYCCDKSGVSYSAVGVSESQIELKCVAHITAKGRWK